MVAVGDAGVVDARKLVRAEGGYATAVAVPLSLRGSSSPGGTSGECAVIVAASRPSAIRPGTPRRARRTRGSRLFAAPFRGETCPFGNRPTFIYPKLQTAHMWVGGGHRVTHQRHTSSPTWHFSRANILGGSNARASVLPPPMVAFVVSAGRAHASTSRARLDRGRGAPSHRRPRASSRRRPSPPLDAQSPRRRIVGGRRPRCAAGGAPRASANGRSTGTPTSRGG